MSLNKLLDYKAGKLPQGLGIGIESVDKYLTYKPNRFTCIIGRANIGKTYFTLWYFTCLAKIHGLKFGIYSIENETWILRMYVMQFIAGDSIDNITPERIRQINHFIDAHFLFIEQGDYTMEKVLNVFADSNMKNIFIDPYNAIVKPPNVNGHEYDYEVIRMIQQYKKEHGSVYINHHPFTNAQRRMINDDQSLYNGYPDYMRYYDIEGGGKWFNGADSFISLHRFVGHRDNWMTTFVIVEKEKVTQTGGNVTPEGAYLQIHRAKEGVFMHNNVDPLLNYRDVKTQYDLQPNENFNNIETDLPF
jgi:hypothetical protein